MGIGNLTPYIILFLVVIVARLMKDKLSSGSEKTGTQVSAVVNSPAEPKVVYENPIDQFIRENHPDAVR